MPKPNLNEYLFALHSVAKAQIFMSNANLGKEFEKLLDAVNHEYKIKKLANIEQTPNAWTFCGLSTYQKYCKSVPSMTAKCADGRFIVRQKSSVDFSGNVGDKSFKFDAKQTKGQSISLDAFTQHQVTKLIESQFCGGLAGFMVLFSDYKRVFFIEAAMVKIAQDKALFSKGKKSFNISELETEIPFKNNKVDWIVLFGSGSV